MNCSMKAEILKLGQLSFTIATGHRVTNVSTIWLNMNILNVHEIAFLGTIRLYTVQQFIYTLAQIKERKMLKNIANFCH